MKDLEDKKKNEMMEKIIFMTKARDSKSCKREAVRQNCPNCPIPRNYFAQNTNKIVAGSKVFRSA
jgi:nitrate/TMAO reductase-like tetraheme cytochrome c subunit